MIDHLAPTYLNALGAIAKTRREKKTPKYHYWSKRTSIDGNRERDALRHRVRETAKTDDQVEKADPTLFRWAKLQHMVAQKTNIDEQQGKEVPQFHRWSKKVPIH